MDEVPLYHTGLTKAPDTCRPTRLGAPRGPAEQLLRRNVQRFQGGLVFKDHRLVYHSALGSRVIKREKKAPDTVVPESVGSGVLHAADQPLNPAPCTLHPAPCTLSLAPCTRKVPEFFTLPTNPAWSATPPPRTLPNAYA